MRFFKVFLSLLIVLQCFNSYSQLKTLGTIDKGLSSAQTLVSQTSQQIAKIEAAVNYVESNNLYKALIDGKEFTFPIGILPESGDHSYALVLNSVKLTPDGMVAEIFMKIPVSGSESLYFIADKIPFNRSGGIAGDATLYLLKTATATIGKAYSIDFLGLEKGGVDKSCQVTFTCKGFKRLALGGTVNFDPTLLVKDTDKNEPVSIDFTTSIDKLSNFTLSLKGIPTFEFKTLPGFKCTINEFSLDKSDVENVGSLPVWYTSSIKDKTGKEPGLEWQGIHMPKVVIQIPKSFTAESGRDSVVIVSEHVIIDQNGVTAKTKAGGKGMSPLLDGKLKGWSYAIDSIRVDLLASTLSKGEIGGRITLPICKEESKVGFYLSVTKAPASADLDYAGRISLERNLNANAFGVARLSLTKTTFKFEYKNKQFYPGVVLDGSITLSPSKDKDAGDKPGGGGSSFANFGLQFQGLSLTTREPYLDIEPGGFAQMSGMGSAMSNFPVSVSKIAFKKESGGQRIGIGMTLNVKLQKSGGDDSEGSSGFGGSASFTVWAKRNVTSQKWEYDNFNLDEIIVEVKNGAFELYGSLSTFDKDQVYGTGVCGYLDLKVIKKIQVKAGAIFGRKGQVNINPDIPLTDADVAETKKEYRYWFVDAAVILPAPIIVTPMIGINGFNGGLYHNMKLVKNGVALPTTIKCQTASGKTYVPDSTIFLGLMAGIGIQSVPTDAVYNGNITFGLEFNNNGGLNMVAFYGGVTILTPPIAVPGANALMASMQPKVSLTASKDSIKQTTPVATEANKGSLRVTWFVQYDVPNSTFTGDFDLYVNIAGVVKGIGAGDKAGHVAVYFSPSSQYVYLGMPVDQMGIDVLGLFQCSSYLCAGSTLPDPPIAPMPSMIPNPPPVSAAALQTGAGLSFGMRVRLNSDFRVGGEVLGCSGAVFAKFFLEAGFDVLISKSNKPVYCGSQDNVRGINNWYATGQAFICGGVNLGYEYDCSIGIGPLKVSYSGHETVLEASFYAYVFAQLPKPSYLKGAVGFQFSLLGLFSGRANYNVTWGKQCANPDEDKDIVFISMITPVTESTEVKVTESVKVSFAKSIETFTFEMADETNEKGGKLLYKGTVDITSAQKDVLVTHNGNPIPVTYKWNEGNTELLLTPKTVLPGGARIDVSVTVILKTKKGNNWVASGKKEIKTAYFNTVFEPVKIDVANVYYAYPLPEMKNYYRMEYATGYIRLGTLPIKPMMIASDYAYNVVFKDGGTEVARATDVKIDNRVGVEQFTYTIPNDKLVNSKVYTLCLVKAPLVRQKQDDKDKEKYTLGYNDAPAEDSTILEYKFTTSRFSSFAQKMAYFNQSKVEMMGYTVVQTLSGNAKDITAKLSEGLSTAETQGYSMAGINTTGKLVRTLGASLNPSLSNGLKLQGAIPDSVAYSYYSDAVVVRYEVFSEIYTQNRNNNQQQISCIVEATNAKCEGSSADLTGIKIPVDKYNYKLGYYLPGRSIKTSEVLMSFDLPQELEF